jgi:gentisate 1,2-dioxygenase
MAPNAREAASPGMTEYYRALEAAALEPLWESMAALAPPEPAAEALPFRWRYAEVRPRLLEAGALITAAEAERRVLVLANPGLPGRHQATDTLYAGLQLILPGEIAPPHRHTQTAVRFVLEGEGAYTAVDGARALMRPGDFIVTPAWAWHEHGQAEAADAPMVWLDGLDVPLVGFLKAGFREAPDGPVGLTGPAAPFHCSYARAREALEGLRAAGQPDPWLGWRLDYADPAAGGLVMPTLGASLTLAPRGFEGRAYRSTDSAVLALVEGGLTAVVGEERFVLEPGDVLAVPGWTPWRLQAEEASVLFALTDRPVHQALGLWREARA